MLRAGKNGHYIIFKQISLLKYLILNLEPAAVAEFVLPGKTQSDGVTMIDRSDSGDSDNSIAPEDPKEVVKQKPKQAAGIK